MINTTRLLQTKRSLTLAAALMGFCASVQATDIYLNENIGFDVPGFNYEQAEYPCNVDKLLVEKIVERAGEVDLIVTPTDTRGDIYNQGIPVLAIDIHALVLGSDEHAYGTKSRSNLPSVRINAALVEKNLFADGYVEARHSCAIATLSEFNPTSNVLDLGSGATTVCDAIDHCLRDLSRDLVSWSQSQLP